MFKVGDLVEILPGTLGFDGTGLSNGIITQINIERSYPFQIQLITINGKKSIHYKPVTYFKHSELKSPEDQLDTQMFEVVKETFNF